MTLIWLSMKGMLDIYLGWIFTSVLGKLVLSVHTKPVSNINVLGHWEICIGHALIPILVYIDHM